MSETKKPETREEDSWFSEAQLERLAPADHADRVHSPIPTQMVSNGEYMPIGQTDKQKEVEARLNALSEQAARKLGMSRRKFLTTSGGFAASFIAMNEVFGHFFDVRPIEMLVPEAYAAGAPQGVFVFDDQTHIIRSSRVGPGNALRDIAQGKHTNFNPSDLPDELGRVNFPWNPALVGLPNLNQNFHLAQYMKDVYLDSQVTVAIMTNNNSAAIPNESGMGTRPPRSVEESERAEILTAEQTMATRDWVNQLAGSKRMLGHGQLYTGVGNLWFIEEQIEHLKPDSWKGYNIATAAKLDSDPNSPMERWTLDDPVVAYPTYAKIDEYARKDNGAILKKYPGFRNLSIHKGLSTNAGRDPRLGHPIDIPKAATDWPQFNFIIYHSCIRPGFWVLNALNDVRSGVLREGVPDILWTTEMAVLAAPFPNVYAEIGTTFASTVITFPTVCAHILGQLLKFMGEDRIVFGSDAVWYGSPQWQIEALWRFQIPEDLCKKYGYPRLTPQVKRKILGLNSARLYGLQPPHNTVSPAVYKPVPKDYESRITPELKRILEYPGTTAAAPQPQFAQYEDDNLARIKQSYAEEGGTRSNTRYGWLRTRA
jgi:uncharacterized protein